MHIVLLLNVCSKLLSFPYAKQSSFIFLSAAEGAMLALWVFPLLIASAQHPELACLLPQSGEKLICTLPLKISLPQRNPFLFKGTQKLS